MFLRLKKFIYLIALALLISVLVPAAAFADTYGPFTVTSSTGATPAGVTWNFPVAGMLTITNTTDTLTISTTAPASDQWITVAPAGGGTTSLVLDGLDITTTTSGYNALTVIGGTLDLTLAAGSTNTLDAGFTSTTEGFHGGLTLYNQANLVIGGEGSLYAKSYFSAAIGAGYASSTFPLAAVYPGTTAGQALGGNITINEGTITATAVLSGAGIGGGYALASGYSRVSRIGDITINGGTIAARGYGGAGIGAGYSSSAGNILIAGGSIDSRDVGGTPGAGIGAGTAGLAPYENANAESLTITGGTLYAAGGPNGGAGIGSGYTFVGSGTATLGSVLITGGTVIASAGNSGADDIGVSTSSTNSPAPSSITITGGSVHPLNNRVAPQPTNGTEDVFLNSLTLGDPPSASDTLISAGSINGVACTTSVSPTPPVYGINSVYTDDISVIYPWLPAVTGEETVIMRIAGQPLAYVNTFERVDAHIIETLYLTSLNVPSAFIDPDPVNGVRITNNPRVTITGLDEAVGSESLTLHYCLDGSSAQEVSQLGSPFSVTLPEGMRAVTFWATNPSGGSSERITRRYLVDLTAPVTVASQRGGTYTEVISLTLNASDPSAPDGSAGSGVDRIYYSLVRNGGLAEVSSMATQSLPANLYTAGQWIVLDASGTYTLSFFAVDRAGNREQVVTETYVVDLAEDNSNVTPSPGADAGGDTTSTVATSSPKTGDSATILPLAVAMVAGSIAITIAVTLYRTREKSVYNNTYENRGQLYV
ncbi:MAG: carbohydrate-binding domain-containing protein [Coriobacteriia bacterium]|nr:carbohydrate-binding domain-containing protein [Coriobacteriia bacterium]